MLMSTLNKILMEKLEDKFLIKVIGDAYSSDMWPAVMLWMYLVILISSLRP